MSVPGESFHALIDLAPIVFPTPPARLREPLAIGDVPIPSRFCLAPLAGYTGLAYRLTIRDLGGLGLCTTDLVNARSLIENRPRSFELAETCPEDRPMAIQIYGHMNHEMAEAAKKVVGLGATIVDINMGCPVNKVVKTGGGSALMCQADAATSLVEAIVKAAGVPVTVKMRLGWDDQTLSAPSLARSFENVGVAAIILHGRTRDQGFKGTVKHEGIRQTVEAVRSIPIIGNGDVRTIHDAYQMFIETGCAAISIGRGALSNPFIFRQLSRWVECGDPGPEPSFLDRVEVMDRHFHALVDRRGERLACLQFRKLIKWYNHAIRPGKENYHKLINLASVAVFEDAVAQIRAHGPVSPLPGHLEPRVPVPAGPIDKW